MDYRFRPATAADFEFCFRLNERNMRPLVEALRGWSEASERESTSRQFREGVDRIVVVDGRDVGHLGVDEGPDELRLRMLALLPEVQSRGLGSALLRDVIRSAHSRGLPLRLRVAERNRRAVALYRRLGFRVTAELERPELRSSQLEMTLRPEDAAV